MSIETTKSPASLGLSLTKKTVVFEGPTRAACAAFPRNVNVHAAVALAGIGFDKTQSRIVADPSVHTNTHRIQAEGEGIHIELLISSFTTAALQGFTRPSPLVAAWHVRWQPQIHLPLYKNYCLPARLREGSFFNPFFPAAS